MRCGSSVVIEAVKTCPNGHPYSNDDKFCMHCGSAIRDIQAIEIAEPPIQSPRAGKNERVPNVPNRRSVTPPVREYIGEDKDDPLTNFAKTVNWKVVGIGTLASALVASGIAFVPDMVRESQRTAAIQECNDAHTAFEAAAAPIREELQVSRDYIRRANPNLPESASDRKTIADPSVHNHLVATADTIDSALSKATQCTNDISTIQARAATSATLEAQQLIEGADVTLANAVDNIYWSHGVWLIISARDLLAETIRIGETQYASSAELVSESLRGALRGELDAATGMFRLFAYEVFSYDDVHVRGSLNNASNAVAEATRIVAEAEAKEREQQRAVAEAERLERIRIEREEREARERLERERLERERLERERQAAAQPTPVPTLHPATQRPTPSPATSQPRTSTVDNTNNELQTQRDAEALRRAEVHLRNVSASSRREVVFDVARDGMGALTAERIVDRLDFDWYDRAAQRARMQMGIRTRNELVQTLLRAGFTQTQAEHGAANDPRFANN